MSEQLTYEQQAQRIATLERKLYHMTEKEAQQAAIVAELEARIVELERQLQEQIDDRREHPFEAIYTFRG